MSLARQIIRFVDWFYIKPVASLVSRQTFRYAACGGVIYLLLSPFLYFLIYNYIVAYRYFDLSVVVLSPHIAALILVFPIVFFVGFWLNRNVTFRQSPVRTRTQLFRYLLSIVGSFVLNYAGMKFFVEVCGIWPTPSMLLTTLGVTVYSFVAAKYFTFRHALSE